MSDFSIRFARSARKELEALPNSVVQRIFEKIEALAKNPRPAGCKKLKGSTDLWRIRIGAYRVIYSILDKLIRVEIIAIRHRSDAYD
jgi:mRNA interferase RelE/StbE